MRNIIVILLGLVVLQSCKKDTAALTEVIEKEIEVKPIIIIEEFGYILNNYKVIKDTIESGESFGQILERNHVDSRKFIK